MNLFHQLLILGSIAISISYATDPSFKEKDNASAILEIIQKTNETLFSNREFHVELLKNYPDLIPVLAEWEYQDWHRYDSSLTREKAHRAIQLFSK